MKNIYNVALVIGQKGDGKTTFLNAYLQKNNFEISIKPESYIFQINSVSNVINDIERICIEVQGFKDEEVLDDIYIQQLTHFLLEWKKGINVIAIVLNGQNDKLAAGTVKLIKLIHQFFNSPNFFSHVCLIFTNWNKEVMTEEDKKVKRSKYRNEILKIIKECLGCKSCNIQIPVFFVNSKKWKEDVDTKKQFSAFHSFVVSRDKLCRKSMEKVLIIDKNDNYSLLNAIKWNNIEIVKSLIDYASKKNIILNVNEKDNDENYPLLIAIKQNNIKMINLLIDYANKNKLILHVNQKNKFEEYPFLLICFYDNIEIIKLLIDYANVNNIILEVNEKDNYEGTYPLLFVTFNNNIEMVKLLMDYANKNNIILDINGKDNYRNYPLLLATFNNNIEIVQSLISYANTNNIILEIYEKK